jgi:MFS family permease
MRRLLLLVGALVFVDTMFFAALTPLLPHYADRYELSKAGAGVLAGAYPAGVLLGGIPSGLVSVRIGVKRTVITGAVLMAGTTVAFGFAGSIAVLGGARFAQGLASALTWSAGQAWLVAAAPPARRGELIGSALGAAIVGGMFGPVLGGIAAEAGSGVTFAGVGVLALALGAWAFATDAPPATREQSLRRLVAAIRNRRIQAGIWLVTLPGLLFGTLGVLVPLRLSELGFGAVAIGAVFLSAAALETVLNPLLGRATDRHGLTLPIRFALLGSIAVSLALAATEWPPVLVALVLAAGLTFGAFYAPGLTFVSHAAEEVGLAQTLAFGVMNASWAVGNAVGPAAGGALANATSDAVPYLVGAGILVLTLAGWRRLGHEGAAVLVERLPGDAAGVRQEP